MKNIRKKIEQLSEEEIDILLSLIKQRENPHLRQQTLSEKKRIPHHLPQKIAIGFIVCLTLLFTILFGGIVISSDFRHMVFSVLEGDGKIIISSEMVDSQVSEEEIANIMHPTALDGQGYTIRADGQFTENYTLTYSKPDSTITFDVRRGEAQIFLDTDWTGWQKINFNGAVIYISNKPDGCTLEMLMQNEVKCSITSQLSPEETLALAKSVGVQSDTKK